MKLSEPQKLVASSNSRFRVLVTGRRFGKTTLAMRELAYHARIPNTLCWYVAPSYRMAKQIAWIMIKKKLKDMRWIKHTNEAELTITLKNNSRICLRGADNPDSLRGIGLDFLVLDECGDIEETTWSEVLRPTLSDTKGRALFCGTPKGIGNWLYDLYTNQDEDWSSHSFTTIQGGFVPESEIEAAKRDLDKKTFDAEYNATFTTYEGIVYYGFHRDHNVDTFTFDRPQNIIHVAIDFNVAPLSAVIFVLKDNKMYVIDEIELHGSNTDELCNEVVSRFPGTKIFAYPDPSGRARKTNSAKTDFHILQNNGFIVKAPNRHLPVRDRINAVNSKLHNGAGERGIMIHPKCKKLITCLERQIYKSGTNQPDKDGGFDHLNDALGYAVSWLFPITRNYETNDQKESWNVKVGA